VLLGSVERVNVRLISREIIEHIGYVSFSKNSNLYDHDTLTLQTDGQTTCHGNTAPCVASRGKN